MAPMKLYGPTLSWNVTRSALALEEAGADYEIVPINFATAEHKSPEHLARNVRTSLDRAPIRPSRSNSNSSSLIPVLMILISLRLVSPSARSPPWRTANSPSSVRHATKLAKLPACRRH